MNRYEQILNLVSNFEYTVITAISLLFVWILDNILETKLFWQKKYWYFILLVLGLQTLVDNYLNGRWFFDNFIVGNYDKFLGILIWHTPLENYFFGFSLISLNLILQKKLTQILK